MGDVRNPDPTDSTVITPANPVTPPVEGPGEVVQNKVEALPLQVEGFDGRKIWTVGTLAYTLSGLVLLFSWLLWGDFALSMRERSVGPLIEKFLLRQGTSNTLKQVLTATLPTAIALLLGPIISYRSDRLRSRWGRRIPFLIIPTPIAGLAMIGIAFSPQMGRWLYTTLGHTPPAGMTLDQAASTCTMSVFAFLWLVFEVAVITSGSVFGGLINDVVPRPVLGRFHGLFRSISLYDGILFNSLLFKHAEAHFTLMFALVGLLFGGGFTLMCLKVKEGTYPPPPAEEAVIERLDSGFVGWLGAFFQRFFRAAIGYLRECYAHPYYLLVFGMLTLAAFTFRPINDFTIRYAAQLHMQDSDYGFLVAMSYLCSLMLAFPLGMLVDRFHAFRMALVAMVLYLVTSIYGAMFIHNAATFGVALVAHTVLSGTYFTCAASLPQVLLPRTKYSQYASANGILVQLIGLMYGPAIGEILDLTHNSYRLTFWAGLILSFLTLVFMVLVYIRFRQYGGTKGYVAPGDEAPATPHEPPKHLISTILLYLAGALIGAAGGYLASFVFQRHEAVPLGQYPALLLRNKDVRDLALFIIATGVLPGAVLGAVFATRWNKRKSA